MSINIFLKTMGINIIHNMDCLEGLKQLPDKSIDCCVTSPPYFNLRDYGVDGQIGLEETPEKYISKLISVFREVKRVLKAEGTAWIIIGDTYNGYKGNSVKNNFDTPYVGNKKHPARKSGFGLECKNLKPKDLIGIPWMLAFALRNDGWFLRQDNIWYKPNPMPESVKDRCTKSHEYVFLLSKSSKYYYDYEAIMEIASYDGRKDTKMKGSLKYFQKSEMGHTQTIAARGHERWKLRKGKYMKNKRSVWIIPTQPFKKAHFAVFPERLATICIQAGCPHDGIVLDPFLGSGTTAVVARKLNRNYVGFELNSEYVTIAENRIESELGMFK